MATNDKTYCVYAHINKVNGKIYIGQTCQNSNRRWNNGNGYKGCTCFYRAIQKYGWDNFDHEVVASNLTLQEANHFEELLIAMLDTTNSDKGYNLQSGGENNKLSEETKRKMSKAHKGKFIGKNNPFYGKHFSEETRIKLSESHKGMCAGKNNPMYGVHRFGEDNPMYGKHHSKESRKKMSESRKDKCVGNDNPRAKAIVCIEANIVYGTAKEVEEKLNINRGNICSCCQGKRKTAGGYHWRYADDINTEDIAV